MSMLMKVDDKMNTSADEAMAPVEVEEGLADGSSQGRRTSAGKEEIKSILESNGGSSPAVRKFSGRLSILSKQYDLDGDGVLNEAEKALRRMDRGDGLDKMAVYNHIQELMATQKRLTNVKRILCLVSTFALLLLASILGLSFAVAKLTDEKDVVSVPIEEETTELVAVRESTEESPVLIATVAEGHVVHIPPKDTESALMMADPYGIATEVGSVFGYPLNPYGAVATDAYSTCEIKDYLTGAMFLGTIPHCRGIYHSAEKAQVISFVSADENHLLPGQSLATVTFHPGQTWADPIMPTDGVGFYKETVHMIRGTSNGNCKLMIFVEELGNDECPYYEIPSCEIPECVARPPVLVSTTQEQEQTSYPQP